MRTLPQWTNRNKFLNLANKRIMDCYCRQCVKPCNHRIGGEHHILERSICVCGHSSILSIAFGQQTANRLFIHICQSNHRSPWHSKSFVSLINILLWLTIDCAHRACHQWNQKESFSFLKSFIFIFLHYLLRWFTWYLLSVSFHTRCACRPFIGEFPGERLEKK